jgi:hypothetical protein
MNKNFNGPPSLNFHSTTFELILAYLWGPTPSPFFYGFLYYIGFVDAYRKYT